MSTLQSVLASGITLRLKISAEVRTMLFIYKIYTSASNQWLQHVVFARAPVAAARRICSIIPIRVAGTKSVKL